MEFILRQIHKAKDFRWLFLANLFLGLHFFSVHFIHSSFLAQYFTDTVIGILFAVSSGLGLFLLAFASVIISRFGNYRTVLYITLIDLLATLGIAISGDPALLVVLFALHIALTPLLYFSLDIFLEAQTSNESDTGNIRGIFLTIATGSALLSPAIAGVLAGTDGSYGHVYLLSALSLLPLVLILITHFRSFIDLPYKTFSLQNASTIFRANKNIRHIVMGQFLMRLYFAWSVIYLPLYLHTTIGFSWPEIGVLLSIMVLPYVLLEWPSGMVADVWLGEKELLVAGFIITIISTIGMYVLTTPHMLIWGTILFFTRIGTALIESMTETYFFKKVSGDDTDSITLFRLLRPLAYTVGPLLATFVLYHYDMQHLWILLAGIMCFGLYHSFRIVDTR